jgi:hypothetical protein
MRPQPVTWEARRSWARGGEFAVARPPPTPLTWRDRLTRLRLDEEEA